MEESPSIKKLPAFYGTRWLITMFTTAHHWSLPCARLIQSTPFHVIKTHFNIFRENLKGDSRAVGKHTAKALGSGTVASLILNLVIS
jgi:hypothetical protein